jgi:hypothetical protein
MRLSRKPIPRSPETFGGARPRLLHLPLADLGLLPDLLLAPLRHKYGYRNFDTNDRSRNTLPFDVVTLGELFQNNHHKFVISPDFAFRWFEIDPTYPVLRFFAALGIVQIPHRSRNPVRNAGQEPTQDRAARRTR